MNTRQIIRNSLLASSLLLAAPAAFADAKEIAESVCIACHGEGGNSVVPTFPKLAGQHPVYMEKQLLEFLEGKRKNEAMEPFLGNFTKSDVPALAAYYAAQQQTPGEVSNPELLTLGKTLYEDGNIDSGVPGCMGCHQANGQGNARYPRLAGQHQAYTLQQMTDFKNGVRTNDRGKLMRAVAERMTEHEMQAVSEYIAGLK